MSVYVDRLQHWGWKHGPSCHLIADQPHELHEFAARIGMQKRWYQRDASTPHYDLTAKRRARAVELGAVELDRRSFVMKAREVRATWTEVPRG